MEFIKDILKNGQVWFEGLDNYDKFARFFADLYRIELYKDGLDVILTKIKYRQIKFEVRIINNWDTNLGCFLTDQKKLSYRLFGQFKPKVLQKIIIRKMAHNVIAHEMAHALEFTSGMYLELDFQKAIAFDMQSTESSLLTLKAEIKRLMVDALKSYPEEQHLSELFARYFELLSISRDVCGKGDFTVADVTNHLINSTNYVKKIFNLEIKKQADPLIASASLAMMKKMATTEAEVKFSDRVESFHKRGGDETNQKWSKNVQSNFSLPPGLQKFRTISDDSEK